MLLVREQLYCHVLTRADRRGGAMQPDVTFGVGGQAKVAKHQAWKRRSASDVDDNVAQLHVAVCCVAGVDVCEGGDYLAEAEAGQIGRASCRERVLLMV